MAANMKKGASDDVAHSYCACIDHEMGDEEINDIAGWETSNPGEGGRVQGRRRLEIGLRDRP